MMNYDSWCYWLRWWWNYDEEEEEEGHGGDDVDEEEQVREGEDDDGDDGDGDVNFILDDNAMWWMMVMTMMYVWLHSLFSIDVMLILSTWIYIWMLFQRYIRVLME